MFPRNYTNVLRSRYTCLSVTLSHDHWSFVHHPHSYSGYVTNLEWRGNDSNCGSSIKALQFTRLLAPYAILLKMTLNLVTIWMGWNFILVNGALYSVLNIYPKSAIDATFFQMFIWIFILFRIQTCVSQQTSIRSSCIRSRQTRGMCSLTAQILL